MKENSLNNFEKARALVISYASQEDAGDAMLPEVFLAVRDTCGLDAFNRLLLLAAAVEDPRYDRFGCADLLSLLQELKVTTDPNADLETLFGRMAEENATIEAEALRKAAAEADPYRIAAGRLHKKFREPSIRQVMHELSRL